jgi:ABC-type Mn2+/Zn2+ transport system permease subunit
MFFIQYFIVSLIVSYIHAHSCYVKGKSYPWKEDILLCVIWPITLPAGIVMIVLSENKP